MSGIPGLLLSFETLRAEGGWIVFLFVLAFVIVGIVKQAKKTDEAWRQAGRQTGLKPTVGGVFGLRKLVGKHKGYKVHVQTGTVREGENQRPVTKYRVEFRQIGLRFVLKRQRFARAPASVQDIEIGVPKFDRHVIVQGKSPEKIRAFLTPERRYRILRAFKAFNSVVISNSYVRAVTSGTETTPGRMKQRIEALVHLVEALRGDDDQPIPELTKAIRARKRGNLKKALGHARKRVEQERTDVDAKVAEAEILYTSRQFEEAKARLEEVRAELPEDEIEVPVLAEEAKVRTEQPQPAAPPPPPPAETSDVKEACLALFGAGLSSVQIGRLFEEKFEGRRVGGTGPLLDVEGFTSDFVFGAEAGTRAAVEVHRVEQDYFGEQEVVAILRLPPEAEETLRARVGERVSFTGTLIRCDPFVRNLFVADASVD